MVEGSVALGEEVEATLILAISMDSSSRAPLVGVLRLVRPAEFDLPQKKASVSESGLGSFGLASSLLARETHSSTAAGYEGKREGREVGVR